MIDAIKQIPITRLGQVVAGTLAQVGIDALVQRLFSNYISAQNTEALIGCTGLLLARFVQPLNFLTYSTVGFLGVKAALHFFRWMNKIAESNQLKQIQRNVKMHYRELIQELIIPLNVDEPNSSDMNALAAENRNAFRIKWADSKLIEKGTPLFEASVAEFRLQMAQLDEETKHLTITHMRMMQKAQLFEERFCRDMPGKDSFLTIYRLLRGKLCYINHVLAKDPNTLPERNRIATFLGKYHVHSLDLEDENTEVFFQDTPQGAWRKEYNECVQLIEPLLHYLPNNMICDWAVQDTQPKPGKFRGDSVRNPFKIVPEEGHYKGWSGHPSLSLLGDL